MTKDTKDTKDRWWMMENRFVTSVKDQLLYELAKQYHEETEAYDRMICSGCDEHGVAIPVGHYELIAINKHAMKVRNRLLEENPCISWSELHKVISRHF